VVTLQIVPVRLQTLPYLQALRNKKFSHLHLKLGERPPVATEICGTHGTHTKGHTVSVQLHAGHPVTLSADVQLDAAERPGAVHVFDVVQKGANGKVQGGFRLLVVAD
jgi:hypothetical protein